MCRWQMLYYMACHLFHRRYWRLSTESLVDLFTILFEIFEDKRSKSNSRRQDSDYKTESWEELSSPWGLSTLVNYHDVCLEAWGASTYYLQKFWVWDLERLTVSSDQSLWRSLMSLYRLKAASFWHVQLHTIEVMQLRGRVEILLAVQCALPFHYRVHTLHMWTIKRWPC